MDRTAALAIVVVVLATVTASAVVGVQGGPPDHAGGGGDPGPPDHAGGGDDAGQSSHAGEGGDDDRSDSDERDDERSAEDGSAGRSNDGPPPHANPASKQAETSRTTAESTPDDDGPLDPLFDVLVGDTPTPNSTPTPGSDSTSTPAPDPTDTPAPTPSPTVETTSTPARTATPSPEPTETPDSRRTPSPTSSPSQTSTPRSSTADTPRQTATPRPNSTPTPETAGAPTSTPEPTSPTATTGPDDSDGSASESVADGGSVELVDARLVDERARAGREAAVEATVENMGARTATRPIAVELDGETVVTRNVTVAGGETSTVTFEFPVAESGDAIVSVGGVEAGRLRVLSASPSSPADDSGGRLAFGVAAAAFVVASAVGTGLLAARREEFEW